MKESDIFLRKIANEITCIEKRSLNPWREANLLTCIQFMVKNKTFDEIFWCHFKMNFENIMEEFFLLFIVHSLIMKIIWEKLYKNFSANNILLSLPSLHEKIFRQKFQLLREDFWNKKFLLEDFKTFKISLL